MSNETSGCSEYEFVEERCRQCGNSYKKLGSHWRMSSQCDYPTIEGPHYQVIEGLLLAGGMYLRQDDQNPYIQIHSTREAFLESLSEFLGPLALPVRVLHEEEELEPQNSPIGATYKSTVFTLRLRNNPSIRQFHRWDVSSVETISPLSLEVVFGLRGRFGDTANYHRVPSISLANCRGDVDWWLGTLSDFHPRIQTRGDGTPKEVFCIRSIGFFDHIPCRLLESPIDRDEVTQLSPAPHTDQEGDNE